MDGTWRRGERRAIGPAKRHGARSHPSHNPSNWDRSGNSPQVAVARRTGNPAGAREREASRDFTGQQFFNQHHALRPGRQYFVPRDGALDADNHVVDFDGGACGTQRFAQSSAQPIAVDCTRDCLAADHVADPSRRALGGRSDQLKEAPIDSAARSKNLFECAGAAKTIKAAAASACRRGIGQTQSRARPLARRAAITLRPPTVCMRLRNPWFRARRSFDG